ncbi:ligand-binding sensor domain-containing protein [Chryseobacterium aureum]|uniref:hypothetical protein n=1 Tax=Chryseobacterium aureum TaxID=2497456 RepID=UPI000F867A21|nr:hypothetical protein [Chryseobacterium aureum]
MDKIAKTDLELDNNHGLFINLKEFVSICFHNKKYSFKINEITPENILIDNGILTIEENKIKINNLYAFSKAFFDVCKENLDFEFSSDFSSTFNFLSEISKDSKGGGFLKIIPFLWEYAIYISNKLHSVLFINISDYLIQNSHNNYFFLNAYNAQLPYLDLENNILIQSVLNIVNHINKESEAGILNINYNSLLNTLCTIAKSNHQKGQDLIKIAIEIENIDLNIISCIIEGLYSSKNTESIGLIENYIRKEKRLDGIFSGLARLDDISEAEAEKFLNYFDEYYEKNQTYKRPLIFILFSILNFENLKNKTRFIDCIFSNLHKIINDEDAVYLVLDRISFLKQYNDERVNIICVIIKKDFYSNEKYLRLIAQTFWYLKDVNHLEKVLNTLSDCKPFSNIASEFIHHLDDYNRNELDKMFIKFITSNKARNRHLGISFFNELNSHYSYHFNYDILKLTPLEQYKLIVSITQNYNEPKNTLPCLIPLLDSSSSTIKEAFICKLEEYSENYGGHVTEVLKENLNENHKNILERVSIYMNAFYDKYVKVKYGINELDSYFTQRKHIELFHKIFNKKMSNMMQDVTNDKSNFLSTVKSIRLAKGGGWKTGDNRDISKLYSIGHSFAMPRNHLIFPNRFDIEHGIAVHTDWKDEDFKLITDLISYEQ